MYYKLTENMIDIRTVVANRMMMTPLPRIEYSLQQSWEDHSQHMIHYYCENIDCVEVS